MLNKGMRLLFALKMPLVGYLLLLIALSACSQSRTGIGKKANQEVWGAQQACKNTPGSELLGCFNIEPNISDNSATIEVLDLGFNPMEVSYRVLARRPQDVAFVVLAEDVLADIGQTFVVKAKSKHYIESYEEWRFETTKIIANDGVGFLAAAVGKGIPMVQVRIFWPELTQPAPKK